MHRNNDLLNKSSNYVTSENRKCKDQKPEIRTQRRTDGSTEAGLDPFDLISSFNACAENESIYHQISIDLIEEFLLDFTLIHVSVTQRPGHKLLRAGKSC